MSEIEIDRKIFIDILQNINTAVEKFKKIEKSVEQIEVVIFGNEINNKTGLTENFRKIKDDIKDMDNLLNNTIVAEIKTLKDTTSINDKINKIETKLEKVDDFVSRLKNLPAHLMWIIPIFSLITQWIGSILIPLFYKK